MTKHSCERSFSRGNLSINKDEFNTCEKTFDEKPTKNQIHECNSHFKDLQLIHNKMYNGEKNEFYFALNCKAQYDLIQKNKKIKIITEVKTKKLKFAIEDLIEEARTIAARIAEHKSISIDNIFNTNKNNRYVGARNEVLSIFIKNHKVTAKQLGCIFNISISYAQKFFNPLYKTIKK